MTAATSNRFVKSAALTASVAIVAAWVTVGGSLIDVQALTSSDMPVYELPRVVVNAKRMTIVELPRVVVTGHRVTNTDSNVAERAAAKTAVRG